MREYCCTAVEIGWQLCASRFLREQRLDELSSQRVDDFGLSRKPLCTRPRAAKATGGAAVVGSMGSIPRAAASCDTRCWRAELGMRHADLLRAATALIATRASAPCMILQCGTWFRCVAVWPCGCVFCGGMSDAIGSKNTGKTFSTEFFDWIRSRNSQSKKGESKKPFFSTVWETPIWASVEKGRFRRTNPTV